MVTVATVAYEIDPRGGPSYLQLAAMLRAQVTSGEIPPGGQLPSIRRLEQETGLAPKTIQHAIRVLQAEGLVYVRPGYGTYAAERP